MGRPPRAELGRWEPRLVLGLVLLAVALWLVPLTSSFWLDETGTVWLIRGSLPEALDRTLEFQGGSPLYYVFAWAARQVSKSELALRVPSTIAMAGATYLLYLLGARLFDRRTGLLASALFVAMPAVGFAAGDARPYAFALLSVIGSAVALVTWLESGRLRHGVLYAVCLVATLYFHYLIAFALLAQVVLVLRFGSGNIKVTLRQALVVAGVGLLLALPLVPNALHVLGQRSVLSNPNPGSVVSILSTLAPPLILGAIVLPAGAAAYLGRRRLVLPHPKEASLLFTIAWLVIPFVILMALTAFTSTDAFIGRYLFSTVPAICLLVAIVLSVVPQVASRYAAVGLAVVAAFAYVDSTHTGEDWREAAQRQRRVASEDTPVILFSGFIEAKQAGWLTDPERSSYLEAPAAAYPLDGRVFAGPWDLGPPEQEYLGGVMTRYLLQSDRFVVLTTGGSSATRMWLDERVRAEGYLPRLVEAWDDKIFLFAYDRRELARDP